MTCCCFVFKLTLRIELNRELPPPHEPRLDSIPFLAAQWSLHKVVSMVPLHVFMLLLHIKHMELFCVFYVIIYF